MERDDALKPGTADRLSALEAENRMLRDELHVARQAAEITTQLVVEQFEKTEAMLARIQDAKATSDTLLRENQGIMDNASVGIAFTRDRKIYRYNECFGTLFGFVGDSGIGQPGRVLYPSDEAYAEVGRLAMPLLSKNKPFEQEMLLQRQDGSHFWANVKAYVADPKNQATGTIWIVQDRAAFKAVQEEIEKSNEEMAAIFESSTLGISFIKDRVMVKANNKLEELFGYQQGELQGRPTRCWYPDEESYRSVGEAYGDLAQGSTHRRLIKMLRKDGSLFWARLSGCAISNDLSRGSVWTVDDITAEYEATQEIAAILESVTHGIAFIRNRTTVKANKMLEEVFGYAPGELQGRSTRFWYPDDESYQAAAEDYHYLAQGLTHRSVVKMQRKDGSLFWARQSGCALSTDPLSGSVWTVEDISAEHAASEAIVRAKEQAEAAESKLRASYAELAEANDRLLKLDQLKSDFLSSVSHELRTPLTSIRGFTHLVEREFSRSFAPLADADKGLGKKSSRIQENLHIILKESDRLTRLINDVLDLAKIEAGRIDWNDTQVQTALLIRDAANAANGMFGNKPEVELRVDVQDDVPAFIGDADRMLQVLVNLLNNAAKFTDHGVVTAHAFLNSARLIQIDIIDTGIGFPPEDAESIFDKFQQSRQGDTLVDRPKGTGLGLAIAREIVERHGGKMRAQSEPGKGSVFSVFLQPIADQLEGISDIATSGPASMVELQLDAMGARRLVGKEGKPRVLVVDDDAGVRDYLSQLLQEQGYAVLTAANGQLALIAAQAFIPHLITMDLAMPVMDGHTAIARLRDDVQLRHIPILVLSALPEWASAGGDLAMNKPLDEPLFLKNIRLLLGHVEIAEQKQMRFLVLYDTQPNAALVPDGFSAHCQMDYCSLDELAGRIQADFEGMLLIPSELLGKVDLKRLSLTPALKVMIMPQVA
jgi:PAS domain S-box-containing protein